MKAPSRESMACVSTLAPGAGFAVQPPQTRAYALQLLELLRDTGAEFSLAHHELAGDSGSVDRATLAAMASHILAKIQGDPRPTSVDLAFDAAVAQKEPESEFLGLPQDSRLAHYSSICQQTLQKHKGPLTAVAPAGAEALNLSGEQVASFLRQIALHDWSKLLLSPWFCGNNAEMVPGRGKPLMDFGKKRACPFFDNMFLGVQLHRLLEPTHHLSVVKKTTGALRTLVEAHLRAAMAAAPIELTCLEIVCDTVEASLSFRCADPDKRRQADSDKENPWIAFAAANFMEDKSQEIPEPYLRGVLSALFPEQAALEGPNCSSAIMEQVRGFTTEKVRKTSAVFDAIYAAYDAAVAEKSGQAPAQPDSVPSEPPTLVRTSSAKPSIPL
jgi:hypothetical protein